VTQPNVPDAAAQKQAALEVFAQYEPPLYEAYMEMMVEWLAAVRAAMFTGGVASLGLVPDPLAVFSQTPKWTALTAEYTAEVAREVLAAPYKNLFADGTAFESRPFVRNWIAQRENRLAAVPDEVFGVVSKIIDSATTNGASIPDVTAQVEQLFDDTGMATWKNRARTVARTEVVGAYNGGTYDAFSMIVENDPGTVWVKRWLATEDARTRPDHVEADGQAAPFGSPFIVGGFQMMYPHDPTAPAKEVVNCRCISLLEEADKPTSMENRQYLKASSFGFNPMEKRDHEGKWTKGGGGLLKSLIGKKDELDPAAEKRRAAAAFDSAAKGNEALAQFGSLSEKKDKAQRAALLHYSGVGYKTLNTAVGKGEKLGGVDRTMKTYLDEALKKGTRDRDVVVFRGMSDPASAFGDAWNDDDVTGLEWTQKAYSSTSADPVTAEEFAKRGGMVMRVLIPKNVKVGGVDMRHPENPNNHEDELLLGRDVRYRVVFDGGVDAKGRRRLDVEVVA
jgi:hypothetical protein